MTRLTALLFSVSLLVTSACNDITGNDGNFVFDALPLDYQSGMVDEAEALPYTRGVQVNGIIVLPSTCYGLEGEHDINRGVITMTVNATPLNSQCPGVMDAASYRFQTFGLSRGVYRVRVVHHLAGTQSRMILEEDVTIN